MEVGRARARAGARALVCFNWLSFPSRTEVGWARARVLVCLIGFHFLLLSLYLPSTRPGQYTKERTTKAVFVWA